MRTRTEVKYDGKPLENADGTLRAIKIARTVAEIPITKAGAYQFARRTLTVTGEFEVPVHEVGPLVAELVSWLAYWAADEDGEIRAAQTKAAQAKEEKS